MSKLLTRDEFRNAVFKRDGHTCVICTDVGVDAHHILERRLFSDGGYYIDNGVTLCSYCHVHAEETTISCEKLRADAGITQVILPSHLDKDQPYDKWGNPILPDGRRLQGELYFDESVQKILPSSIVFVPYVKYPRTYHLPWSPGLSDDDRVVEDLSYFQDNRVIVTEKMDGENTTMYPDHIHARSLTSSDHPSRHLVKAIHARVKADIPKGWRLCGENLFATHSIHYDQLPGYFMLFSIWEGPKCLSWDETVEWATLLELPTVPVLYDGPWDESLVKEIPVGPGVEGYVVRLASTFGFHRFRNCVAKYVRENHVQTSSHWMQSKVVPNGLAVG